MKKIVLLIFLIIFIISLLFTLSQDKKSENTITFWTLQLGTFDEYINDIISEFEAKNEGIKIKWIDIPYSEGEKRALASILTDNPPDLINITPDFSLMLAQKNALFFINETELENFIPSIKNTLKCDDKYFGIPFYATSAVTFYNKKLAQKNNIKVFPKTYDELFKLKTSYGYLTMINFSENDTLLKILNKYDINNFETISNTKSIKLFEEFKRIYDTNLIPKESITQTHRDALEKYMAGQIVFLSAGANFLNMIKENSPEIYSSTEVLPQLTGDSGLYDYSLMNFVIPKKAQHKEDALKFALFLTNKENQIEFAKLTPILPVNKDALADSYFKSNSNETLEKKARIISANQLNNLLPPLNIKNKKDLNKLSSDSIQEILINDANIKTVLENFSKNWELITYDK